MLRKLVTVGLDASRNRSGGARAYLIGILAHLKPEDYGIRKVHLWSYQALLEKIPDYPWLEKHSPSELSGNLVRQLWWQATQLEGEAKAANCDILFSTDASTLSHFKPLVVFSQDLLSYEPGVIRGFRFGLARIRLHVILWVQNAAFRRAQGVIFLNRYVANLIQKSCGKLLNATIIPHGVGEIFKQTNRYLVWPSEVEQRPIQCLYVSNAAMYKHQWQVVKAIKLLRDSGHDIKLTLVGGGSGEAQKILDQAILKSDPKREFVRQFGYVPQDALPNFLASANLFVFASSCEAWGITLVEAMAVGLPIACSNRSSLPEVLGDAGVYFDPENPTSIANAIESIITDSKLRKTIAARAKARAQQFSWARCASETWSFVIDCYRKSVQR